MEKLSNLINEYYNPKSDLKKGLKPIIKTGFKDFDEQFSGFYKEELVIIGARPGMGKSHLTLKMAFNQAKAGNKVGVYSLNLSAKHITNLFISFITNIPPHNINSGELSPTELNLITDSLKVLNTLEIYIEEHMRTIEAFRNSLSNLSNKEVFDIIYLDNLQLFSLKEQEGRYLNRKEEVRDIIYDLKSLSLEFNISIVIISQLNRTLELRGGEKRPQLSDIKESSCIEELADKVIFLWRPEYYGFTEGEDGNSVLDKAHLIIAKNKLGYTGEVELFYNGRFSNFLTLEK
ncbi:hypothetical protein FRY74_06185 [Vicingus serpentipes]|uniref:SF4 helicase domain-containing protein n=1 Tax=Vicingus serpentipes TaxID=1926625 RepID=A0A5C6RUW9_9FLAO|nr:DnaB-like helicase C-terminal domain-containing protein [Vicingus serpentipes]TXB66158.1 hypothetical protein FRY74_06185 [Vicingus serpentipes]